MEQRYIKPGVRTCVLGRTPSRKIAIDEAKSPGTESNIEGEIEGATAETRQSGEGSWTASLPGVSFLAGC
jgi:hypothetical protein